MAVSPITKTKPLNSWQDGRLFYCYPGGVAIFPIGRENPFSCTRKFESIAVNLQERAGGLLGSIFSSQAWKVPGQSAEINALLTDRL